MTNKFSVVYVVGKFCVFQADMCYNQFWTKMFKKFSEAENVSSTLQLKSSVQKSIRNKVVEEYPMLESVIDHIFPKKETFKLIKCQDHLEIVTDHKGDLVFFKSRDGPYVPTLRYA